MIQSSRGGSAMQTRSRKALAEGVSGQTSDALGPALSKGGAERPKRSDRSDVPKQAASFVDGTTRTKGDVVSKRGVTLKKDVPAAIPLSAVAASAAAIAKVRAKKGVDIEAQMLARKNEQLLQKQREEEAEQSTTTWSGKASNTGRRAAGPPASTPVSSKGRQSFRRDREDPAPPARKSLVKNRPKSTHKPVSSDSEDDDSRYLRAEDVESDDSIHSDHNGELSMSDLPSDEQPEFSESDPEVEVSPPKIRKKHSPSVKNPSVKHVSKPVSRKELPVPKSTKGREHSVHSPPTFLPNGDVIYWDAQYGGYVTVEKPVTSPVAAKKISKRRSHEDQSHYTPRLRSPVRKASSTIAKASASHVKHSKASDVRPPTRPKPIQKEPRSSNRDWEREEVSEVSESDYEPEKVSRRPKGIHYMGRVDHDADPFPVKISKFQDHSKKVEYRDPTSKKKRHSPIPDPLADHRFKSSSRKVHYDKEKIPTSEEESATDHEFTRSDKHRVSNRRTHTVPSESDDDDVSTYTQRHVHRRRDSPPRMGGASVGQYSGEGSVEEFLLRFDTYAHTIRWTREERTNQLCLALSGAALRVVSGLGPNRTFQQIRHKLMDKYGAQIQRVRYEADLKGRRRRPGESIQSLYDDIDYLLPLAHPSLDAPSRDHIGMSVFLDALDPDLVMMVKLQNPCSMVEARACAINCEAIKLERDRRAGNQASPMVQSTPRPPAVDDLVSIVRGLSTQWENFAMANKGHREVVQPTAPLPVAQATHISASDTNVPTHQTEGFHKGSGQNRFRRRDSTDQSCHACNGKGHWSNEPTCPKYPERQARLARRSAAQGNPTQAATVTSANPTSMVTQPSASVNGMILDNTGSLVMSKSAVYLLVYFGGKTIPALLDTGAEMSVVGTCLLSDTQIAPTKLALHAANGTSIPLRGQLTTTVSVGSIPTSVNLLVSDHIFELILGSDWLHSNNCIWDFPSKRLTVGGVSHHLGIYQPAVTKMRRLYVTSDIKIPSRHALSIPTTVARRTLAAGSESYIIEPCSLGDGVTLSRLLISSNATEIAVPIINLSDKPLFLKKGQLLAEADPIEASDILQSVEPPPPTLLAGEQHLQAVIDGLPKKLSRSERRESIAFIRSYATLFSKDEYDIGRTSIIQHEINTGQSRPFKQQMRRQPPAYEPKIEESMDKMTKSGVISPASGPFGSNITMVRKSNGDLRFCIDYRQLNAITVKDSYPLPRIDACHDALAGCSYFSTLDMRSGYWQVPLSPETAAKTAFLSRRGLHQFNVLPFGLTNAPAIFQRLMDLVLAGLTWEICLAFLDDIIVMSKDFKEHIRRLRQVFDRLRGANLKLNPTKCHLFQSQVRFLGSIISGEGISPDPEKLRAIREWPIPVKTKDVRAFTALAGYYRRHIKNFAHIARPLYALQSPKVRFQWNPEHQKAFEALQQALSSAPIVGMPRDEGDFILDTDASDLAMGAVLSQIQDGRETVIAYASKVLKPAELHYCTTRKELLAVMYGLTEFRHYLLGRAFKIRTDHAALTSLMTTPVPLGQQARWLDLLAEYPDKSIVHRAGTSHSNADGLSRRPCEANSDNVPCKQCTKTPKLYTPCEEIYEDYMPLWLASPTDALAPSPTPVSLSVQNTSGSQLSTSVPTAPSTSSPTEIHSPSPTDALTSTYNQLQTSSPISSVTTSPTQTLVVSPTEFSSSTHLIYNPTVLSKSGPTQASSAALTEFSVCPIQVLSRSPTTSVVSSSADVLPVSPTKAPIPGSIPVSVPLVIQDPVHTDLSLFSSSVDIIPTHMSPISPIDVFSVSPTISVLSSPTDTLRASPTAVITPVHSGVRPLPVSSYPIFLTGCKTSRSFTGVH